MKDDESKSSHWDEVEGYPVEDWREEVNNNDTRLGYLDWVRHRKEGQEECRTCGSLYDTGGDGYDGECPSCADKSELRHMCCVKDCDGDAVFGYFCQKHIDEYYAWRSSQEKKEGEV